MSGGPYQMRVASVSPEPHYTDLVFASDNGLAVTARVPDSWLCDDAVAKIYRNLVLSFLPSAEVLNSRTSQTDAMTS